jgi:3-oxoacid CoA-transferase subunit B
LQVSEKGDLANWRVPGAKGAGGIGGAMDISVGAEKLIVTMEHNAKDGQRKIVKVCSYPLTAIECVNTIITDLAVIDVTAEGLVLREVAPGFTPEEVQAQTEPRLLYGGKVPEMALRKA